MLGRIRFLAALLGISTLLLAMPLQATERPHPRAKEWTLLIFLNGNNNLNQYARYNLVDMERVGSTDQVNVVAQWADIELRDTRRLYITKSDDPTHITSPVIKDLGPDVDMGDWHELADFITWGVKNFPAKHYFVDVWDHGTGWHQLKVGDISHDDLTKHWITTRELALALAEGKRAIGHKIDVYGSDACQMSMIEIAAELADSVSLFAGSEADIPVDGWPYARWFWRWQDEAAAAPRDVARLLHEEFLSYFRRFRDGSKEATFSVLDLGELPAMLDAIKGFGNAVSEIEGSNRQKAIDALNRTVTFSIDYIDLLEFADNLARARLEGFDTTPVESLHAAASKLVLSSGSTSTYKGRANGLSIWFPPYQNQYDHFVGVYKTLDFSKRTHWEDAITPLLH